MAKVTILLDTKTRNERKVPGRKDQTYDQLLLELISEHHHQSENKRRRWVWYIYNKQFLTIGGAVITTVGVSLGTVEGDEWKKIKKE